MQIYAISLWNPCENRRRTGSRTWLIIDKTHVSARVRRENETFKVKTVPDIIIDRDETVHVVCDRKITKIGPHDDFESAGHENEWPTWRDI